MFNFFRSELYELPFYHTVTNQVPLKGTGASMNLLSSFKQYIKTENLFAAKDRLLLAVSGGVDSVVLCELCQQAGYHFAIAHCNFQLRGEESNGDEVFVTALAKKYGVDFFVEKFDTQAYVSENKSSIQVAARELRYNWFAQLINQSTHLPIHLLTAHHADDNMETILMNFFKGSGINGLKGILPKQQHITRPLLFASKEEILEFASEYNLNFREDSSNSSDKYTRNYFRNQLIPGLEKVFPQVKENLLNNANRFREINTIYQSAVEQIKQKLVVPQGSEIHIPVLKLLKTPALNTIIYELIKDFDFTAHQASAVEKLLHSESGKYVESGTHRILRNRKWLIIAPLQQDAGTQYLVKEEDAEIIFPQGTLHLAKKEQPGKISTDPDLAQLDSRHIQYPLLLRKWKKGDYFYPLGMPRKKKIGRFLTDLKYALTEREKVWVLESNKNIIWVVGIRIDDRFKITPATTTTLQLQLGSPK